MSPPKSHPSPCQDICNHSNEHPNSKITSSLKKKKKLSVPFPPLIWFFLPRIDNRQLLFMRSETDGCAAMSFCLFGRARKSCSRTEEAKGKSRYFDLNFLPFFCPKIFVPSCHYSNYIISSYSYNFLIKTKNISIDRQICFSSYFCWRVDFFLLIPADRTKQNKIFERKLKINERKNKKFIILSKANRKKKKLITP